MNQYFDIPIELLKEKGAFQTAKEISQQPSLWLEVLNLFKSVYPDLNDYLLKLFKSENDIDIIFTGAGSSAYIGNVLACQFPKFCKTTPRAIPSTDLITHPECFINKEKSLLLISFARSGDSPESKQVIKLAQGFSRNTYHLIITCNPNGELTRIMGNENVKFVVLPPDSLDQGLAMTSSFSSMLLFGLMLICGLSINELEEQVNVLNIYGDSIITWYIDEFKKIAGLNFTRAVFLGSSYLKGIACESSLKLEELTDGKIISYYDSFVGFRHGPRVLVNEDTLIVYLFSNNPHSLNYEKDLVREISSSRTGLYSVGVMDKEINGLLLDSEITMSSDKALSINEMFLPVVSVLPAQIIAFFKSLAFGLQPDSPSQRGVISRVVEGVTTYPYNEKVF